MAGTTPVRRTQVQRRAETRGKLLDAAVQSLAELGYARTTTREVAERAGVSSGAMTHHFPRRVDLVAAALEHLARQRIAALAETVGREPEEILEVMWADFSSPTFTVFVKVWIAAAEDAELHARLLDVERLMTRTVARMVAEMRERFDAPEDFEARITVLLATLRGLALSHAFEPGARGSRRTWEAVRPLLTQLVTGR